MFAEDSLATLRSAPVVDLHPAGGRVTTEIFKALSLGHVHDDVRPQGDLVVATTTVDRAEACARIDRGERAEISCGYRCDLGASDTPLAHGRDRAGAAPARRHLIAPPG